MRGGVFHHSLLAMWVNYSKNCKKSCGLCINGVFLVNFEGHTMLPMLLLELDMEWTVS